MRLCSYTLKCQEFDFDFAKKEQKQTYKLYKEKDALSSYYPIPGSKNNLLKLSFSSEKYNRQISQIKNDFLLKYLLALVAVAFFSALFALYALSPLQKALRLTEEFVKDILHDFNTPLSILRLNAAMLKNELPNNSKIERIEGAVASVLSLQQNLRSYLSDHAFQKERFDLSELIDERIKLLEKNYPRIDFKNHLAKTVIECNKSSCERIVENILSNAAKYNDKNGFVKVEMEKNTLVVEDNGKGIKNTKKIFERFYKEQERGIGIGLHIVKKLCDEMGIEIEVKSEAGKGTRFMLDLTKVMR